MDQEAVGTYVRLALEGPLVAFYVTVLLCIVCGMLRGSFRSGFFKIYLLLCFADLTEYSAIVIFYRLPRVGALEGLWKNGYGRLGVFLNVYFLLFQMSAHTAIALNRYFTIVMPLSKWNLELKGKKFFFALVVLSGLPLTTCWVSMVCRTWGIVESSQAGIYVITCDTPSSYAISSIGIGIYSVVTSIISFMLELKTYIVYRRHSKHLKCRHVEDYRLLVFAMLTFVGQFMHTARSAVIIVVMYFFAGNRDVTGIVQILTYTYLAELFCLGSPICLFITSRLLRNKYRQMYFFMLPSARDLSRTLGGDAKSYGREDGERLQSCRKRRGRLKTWSTKRDGGAEEGVDGLELRELLRVREANCRERTGCEDRAASGPSRCWRCGCEAGSVDEVSAEELAKANDEAVCEVTKPETSVESNVESSEDWQEEYREKCQDVVVTAVVWEPVESWEWRRVHLETNGNGAG